MDEVLLFEDCLEFWLMSLGAVLPTNTFLTAM